MASFAKKYGLRGAVISAVDLVQGLGAAGGMDVIKVPGVTGMPDTNYEGKATAAIEALKDHDIVFVHVEATDEVSHIGDVDLKLKAIEFFDTRIAKPIMEALERMGEYRVLLLPDHPTPIPLRTHTSTPVPFIAASSADRGGNGCSKFTEAQAGGTGVSVRNGHDLLGMFIREELFG